MAILKLADNYWYLMATSVPTKSTFDSLADEFHATKGLPGVGKYFKEPESSEPENLSEFDKLAQEHQEEQGIHPGRLAMHATIGGAEGAMYKGPQAVPAQLLNISVPAARENVVGEMLSDDLEQSQMYPNEIHPLSRERFEAASQQAEENFLQGKTVTGAIMSLPYRVFGQDTRQLNDAEKYAHKTGELVSLLSKGGKGVPGAGELGYKETAGKFAGASPTAQKQAKEMIVNLGKSGYLSTAAIIGNELYGLPGELGFMMGADMGVNLVKMGSRLGGVLWERLRNPMYQAELRAMSPEQQKLVKPYLDIAKEHGIPINIGAITDNPEIQKIENTIASSNLTGKEADNFRRAAGSAWMQSYYNMMSDTANAAAYESPGAIARELKANVLNPHEEAILGKAKTLYNESSELFQGAAPLGKERVQELDGELNSLYKTVTKTLTPTPTEKAVADIATETSGRLKVSPTEAGKPQFAELKFDVGNTERALTEQSQAEVAAQPGRKTIAQAEARQTRAAQQTVAERQKAQNEINRLFGKNADNVILNPDGTISFRKEITPDQLVATIRSLNDKIQWGDHSVINLLAKFRAKAKDILVSDYSGTHREAVKKYLQANNTFKQGAEKFWGDRARYRNWNIQSSTDGDALARELNSVHDFKQFESDFGRDPKGRQLIDYLKRKKADQLVEDVFSRQGQQYMPGTVSGKMQSLKNNQLFQYSVGPENYNKLNQLAKLDEFLAKNSKHFYTANISPEVQSKFLEDVGVAGVINKPMAAVKIGFEFARKKGIQDFASLYHDPALMDQMITIAKNAPEWKKNPEYWENMMRTVVEAQARDAKGLSLLSGQGIMTAP